MGGEGRDEGGGVLLPVPGAVACTGGGGGGKRLARAMAHADPAQWWCGALATNVGTNVGRQVCAYTVRTVQKSILQLLCPGRHM